MDKWSIFGQIPPESWEQEAQAGGGSVWRLSPNWCQYYFEGVYTGVIRDGDPFAPRWSVAVFTRADKLTSEITVFSSRSKTKEYYDFTWVATDGMIRPKKINRVSDGKPVAVEVTASCATPGTIRISSPDIDEQFDLNLENLSITLSESKEEKEQRLAPWKRILLWYAMIKPFDPQAYARVPLPVRTFLESGPAQQPWASFQMGNVQTGAKPEEIADRLTWQQLEAWQQQKLMPMELSWLWEASRAQVLESIRLQQKLANDPYRQPGQQANPMFVPQIPAVVRRLKPENLQLIDLQVLMTIGVLREVWGYREREIYKLMQRRPDLKGLDQTPQGKLILQQDAEYQMILNHPLSIRQQDDDMEAYQHRQGNNGPTPKQQLIESERATQAMMNQMWAQSQQSNAMMNSMMSSMGIFMPAAPLPPPPPPNPFFQEEPPPAWVIYRPYMI